MFTEPIGLKVVASNSGCGMRPRAGSAFRALLRALLLFVSLAGADAAIAAERLGKADRAAIEATIRHQLDAFVRDDAERAFGYATADIQRQFGSSDNFLEMVRDHYEPVYRAVSVEFVRLTFVDGRWVQTVQLVDGEGRVWRALFTMRRHADRSWKVGGCQLVQTNSIAT